MSDQFGIWNLDGRPAQECLQQASALLAPQGPDGQSTLLQDNIGIVHCAFHTTKESRYELQPHSSPSRIVATWNGRMDNRDELSNELSLAGSAVTDVALAASAFERWGSGAFARLTGDWALSLWNPRDKTLQLATDYMGIFRLYVFRTLQSVVWCTQLDPLVHLFGTSLTIDDEYIAGYLTLCPTAHCTPYREIQAVSPGCFVTIRDGRASTHRYWAFHPRQKIAYKTDAEYEDHFRSVFRQAVRRRLRSDTPVLAELSGGLDSSAIVCMADHIAAKGETVVRLDTVSYYDPAEPASDERPYIAHVEEKRGRKGHHIDAGLYGGVISFDYPDLVAAPGANGGTKGIRAALCELMQRGHYRVVLSGIGGDEFLGGIPNPAPQLADLIVTGRLVTLARELATWSLIKKRPWIHLFWNALILLLPTCLRARFNRETDIAPWVDANFAKRHRLRIRQMGPQGGYGFWQPSRIGSARTLIAMRRQLAYSSAYGGGFEERRYPFLDQHLIEFLLAIPVRQLLRPGQRRSLMRRALAGLVPSEILSRRTKGSVARSALATIEHDWPAIETFLDHPLSVAAGYIDGPRFAESLRLAKIGDSPQLVDLIKTLHLEAWLRHLAKRDAGSQSFLTAPLDAECLAPPTITTVGAYAAMPGQISTGREGNF